MKAKIAIIGDGHVGTALHHGLEGAGYEVKSVGKDPDRVRDLTKWGEIIFLAVPYSALHEVIPEMGDDVRGKILVDVTNVLTSDLQLALGFTTSGGEELQKELPNTKVVKAFNTVFSEQMSTGKVKDTPISLFVASDDKEAKDRVIAMGRDLGFDAIDAGPLRNARWLETLGFFNIQLGHSLRMGREIGFRLIH